MVSAVIPGLGFQVGTGEAPRTEDRAWSLLNLDTGESFEFAYEGTNVGFDHGAGYAQIKAVGRQNPVLQFVAGDLEVLTFTARLFRTSTADSNALLELLLLREWVKIDESLGRPPILSLRMGDGHLALEQCVLFKVAERHVDRMSADGGFKGAEVALTLARYEEFDLSAGLPTESRYHRVRHGEYYEMLAQIEYGDPLVGDALRARNPTKRVLTLGDVVKLPSRRAIAKDALGLRSVPLAAAFARKDSAARANFRDTYDARGAKAVSRVLR